MDNCNNKLEEKIDRIMEAVNRVDGKIQSMDATIKEREKSEILRNEVLAQALKTQAQAHDDLKQRVDKLESNQSKIAWLVITIVVTAVIGLVIVGK